MRGDLDVSQQAMAVPESPGVVRFDPATRTLTAIGVGEVPLGITMGDKIARVRVIVRPRAVEPGSKLVVEPGSLRPCPRAGRPLECLTLKRPAARKSIARARPSSRWPIRPWQVSMRRSGGSAP